MRQFQRVPTAYITEKIWKGVLKLTLIKFIPIVFAPLQHVKLPINVKIPVTIWQIVIPAFFFRKKGYINFVSKSVRPSVTFLVNVSPPKPLEVATSNFVGE